MFKSILAGIFGGTLAYFGISWTSYQFWVLLVLFTANGVAWSQDW